MLQPAHELSGGVVHPKTQDTRETGAEILAGPWIAAGVMKDEPHPKTGAPPIDAGGAHVGESEKKPGVRGGGADTKTTP